MKNVELKRKNIMTLENPAWVKDQKKNMRTGWEGRKLCPTLWHYQAKRGYASGALFPHPTCTEKEGFHMGPNIWCLQPWLDWVKSPDQGKMTLITGVVQDSVWLKPTLSEGSYQVCEVWTKVKIAIRAWFHFTRKTRPWASETIWLGGVVLRWRCLCAPLFIYFLPLMCKKV